MISSGSSGNSGLAGGWTGAKATCFTVRLPSWRASSFSLRPGGGSAAVLEDEGDNDADQREGLGQREPDVHVGLDQAARLRLPGHGLDSVAEDQADADARADCREAIRHGTDVDTDDLGCRNNMRSVKHVAIPLRSCQRFAPAVVGEGVCGSRQCPASSDPPMY